MSDQPMTKEQFLARDLWLEARNTTAAQVPDPYVEFMSSVIRVVRLFIPGRVQRFGTLESMLMVDLNKYRPDCNVELLIDQGVKLFGLRVGGPKVWNYPNEPVMDATFTMYHKRIRDYAKAKGVRVWILGYGVHNAWSDEESNYTSKVDPQVQWLKEATRNHICDLYCWDDEIAECWKNGMVTTITPSNLVKSIRRCMEQTLVEMERNPDGSYKIPVHYGANWFMQRYGLREYQTWLDNAAIDPANRKFLTWRAWVPIIFSDQFPTLRALFDKLITPTGLQENKFMKMGSEPPCDLWQATFTAKGPWESKLGVDSSISYGRSATVAQFAINANLITAAPPTTDTQPPTAPASLLAMYQNGIISLEWGEATDNVGVTGYTITRNGVDLGSVGTTLRTYLDGDVQPGMTYQYGVYAKDAAGNRGPEATASATVPGQPPTGGEYTEQLNQIKQILIQIRDKP